MTWRVAESDHSLDNWISMMDLYCVDKYWIGLLGSSYYSGFLIGSALFMNLADRYGRRPCVIAVCILHTLMYLWLILTTNLTMHYVLIFIIGVIGGLRCGSCLTLAIELVHS